MISIGIGTGSFFLNRRLISLPINNRTMHVNPTINAAILVVVIFESTAAMLCNTTEVSQSFLRKYSLHGDLPQKSKLYTAVQLCFYSAFITTVNQCLTKIPIVPTKHRSSEYLSEGDALAIISNISLPQTGQKFGEKTIMGEKV